MTTWMISGTWVRPCVLEGSKPSASNLFWRGFFSTNGGASLVGSAGGVGVVSLDLFRASMMAAWFEWLTGLTDMGVPRADGRAECHQ
ncbi:hypothetical protein D187_005429 [Cystobacter fuscus DSM 2262]|uniref:Uncharacterized protein n=1 Tax=Cystobacter fuscus (strain ATCC 25194 / DSM 2262 / NBRC 100088 / M29) TaxID=1242864 RepID=S9PJ14_CYSF2|nr:hypothetical protein D187_005429 [Cystobacter fuscus DSM 2262]